MDSSTTELPDTTIPAARPKPKLGSLRALWPFVRRHTGLFVAWLLALACSSGATLTLPVAFRQMIDHGFSSGTNIDRTFSLVFAVVVVLALATAARFFFVSLLGERVVADLRNRRDVLGPVLARHGITLREDVIADRPRSILAHLPPVVRNTETTAVLGRALDDIEHSLRKRRRAQSRHMV